MVCKYTRKIVFYKNHIQKIVFNSGAYAGFLKGGGPTLKFLGFWIYMPRSGMSRAAKLRAFARGVWGHAPPRKNFKMVQFRAFCGLFSTTFMVKNSLKKI